MRYASTVLLATALTVASCHPPTEKASWTYVREAWCGVTVLAQVSTASSLRVTVDLGKCKPTRIDSGICPYRVSLKRQGHDLVLTLHKGLCSESASHFPLTLNTVRPPHGRYNFVYDDREAKYPLLAVVDVP